MSQVIKTENSRHKSQWKLKMILRKKKKVKTKIFLVQEKMAFNQKSVGKVQDGWEKKASALGELSILFATF